MRKTKSWRTSAVGYALLAVTAAQIASNPKALLREDNLTETVTQVTQALIGLGFIKAADHNSKETKKEN